MFKHVSAQIQLKDGDSEAKGMFTAYASVFNNVDSYGDVVMPGAFAETLSEWKSREDNLPLLFSHNMADPDYNIGHIVEAVEDGHGLKVTGQIDLETPKGAQVYRLLKAKRINQLSFAYDVLEGVSGERDGDYVYELKKLKLYEVSIVTIGANQATEVLDVKRLELSAKSLAKAGRVLAQKHIDSLRSAQEAIAAVIIAAEAVEDSKTENDAEVKDEDVENVKSEDFALEKKRMELSIGLLC